MPGVGHGDRAARPTGGPPKSTKKTTEQIRNVWPELREMILPRRKLLALGFFLMVIKNLSGLVLPYSTKYLIDDILGKGQRELLTPLVLAVLGATLVQGVTSFALTQVLSKAAQRLIAELREKVQRHVGLFTTSGLGEAAAAGNNAG